MKLIHQAEIPKHAVIQKPVCFYTWGGRLGDYYNIINNLHVIRLLDIIQIRLMIYLNYI